MMNTFLYVHLIHQIVGFAVEVSILVQSHGYNLNPSTSDSGLQNYPGSTSN